MISVSEPLYPFLKEPICVKDQQWNPDIKPYVSISCITYNHEHIIKEALDGFLMQRTSFRIEVLVHDDASTDTTASIIRGYEEKYPQVFKVLYQKENQYSKNIQISYTYQYPRAQGMYFAFCEGDDFWTDPLKLQKQFEILEDRPNVAACFTNAVYLNQLDNTIDTYVKNLEEGIVPVSKLIEVGGSIYPTASIVIRRQFLLDSFLNSIPELAGDELLIYSLSLKGDIYFLNQNTCTYRRWSGGVFSSISKNKEKLVAYKMKDINGYQKFDNATNGIYSKFLANRVSRNSLYIIKNSSSFKTKLKYLRFLKFKDFRKLITGR